MPTTTIAGHPVDVDDEGFMTNFEQWTEEIAQSRAQAIDIDMTEEHWKIVKFVREDFHAQGETPTIRRMSSAGGFDIKRMFALFPQKPAKKMAFIAGVPKPHGCV